jgi:hypothetical protein
MCRRSSKQRATPWRRKIHWPSQKAFRQPRDLDQPPSKPRPFDSHGPCARIMDYNGKVIRKHRGLGSRYETGQGGEGS